MKILRVILHAFALCLIIHFMPFGVKENLACLFASITWTALVWMDLL